MQTVLSAFDSPAFHDTTQLILDAHQLWTTHPLCSLLPTRKLIFPMLSTDKTTGVHNIPSTPFMHTNLLLLVTCWSAMLPSNVNGSLAHESTRGQHTVTTRPFLRMKYYHAPWYNLSVCAKKEKKCIYESLIYHMAGFFCFKAFCVLSAICESLIRESLHRLATEHPYNYCH